MWNDALVKARDSPHKRVHDTVPSPDRRWDRRTAQHPYYVARKVVAFLVTGALTELPASARHRGAVIPPRCQCGLTVVSE